MKKPDLPVAAASTFLGDPFKNYKDYNRENSFVLSKQEEIDRFEEAFGNDWVKDQYYIRHPKTTRTNTLIPAKQFHAYIMREQIGDLISYIRANLRVKELDLSIKTSKAGSIGLKGIIEGVPMEGSTSLSMGNDYTVKIKCPSPLKASEKKTEYLWINHFPHLIDLIDEASHGLFSINESFDLSFGLDVSAAKSIGVNLDYNGRTEFNFAVIAD
ncbi:MULTISPECIES: hypothetical protein [unclassified Vibrio]|uniref:hypothetical protein n=1 Tax=unclassified Vibrio TaxID=2614977 RepID=UPI00354F1C47